MHPRTVVHPVPAPPRGGVRTWWAKAWVRAVEETVATETDLSRGRSLARPGPDDGALRVSPGEVVTTVGGGGSRDGPHVVRVGVPVLADPFLDAFVEVVAARPDRLNALLAGDLPHELVEHAEEAGVELLPYGDELETACPCGYAGPGPCRHAVAVLVRTGWLVERDPSVLVHLRGLTREELTGRVRAATTGVRERDEPGLDAGLEAALRAQRVLDALAATDPDVGHLF